MKQSVAIVTLQLLCFVSLLLLSTYASVFDDERYFLCNPTNNYTNGSIYGQNVNTTINSLASNASSDGFYITSVVGQDLDTVYGLVQCLYIISKEDCQTCVETAAKDIGNFCQNKKEAMIGYSNCSLRYSDRRFFSTPSNSPIAAFANTADVTYPDVFNPQLANLFKNLSSTAASSTLRFAVGTASYSDFASDNIYGMVQCTRDLSENSCSSCLQEIISVIPQCCRQSRGVRIFAVSCNLRHELYRFFLTTSTSISLPLSPPPPPPSLDRNSVPGATTNTTSSDGKKSTSKTMVVIVVSVAMAAMLVILVVCGCLFWRKAKKKVAGSDPDVHDHHERNMESLLIGLDTIKAATRNFSDEYKLGQGGFGPVYKGTLFDGTEIAVKRLSSNSGQGLIELKTEVMLVAKLLHRNLVKLLGFCLEEKEKLLVYEFLPNGSLDKILFDQNKRSSLEWERRYRIIVGIARGLLYLHEDSQLRIIHRDLKASNILLDEQMNPKISDFGLAKLFGDSQTRGNTTRIAGTYGYMAPEYARNGYFSPKSDVYSFGVLVLELVTGHKNSVFRDPTNLLSHAWLHWTNGTALEIIDPSLGDQWPRFEVLKSIHIGLLCVQEAAADRPTMSEIITMLSSYTITVAAPLRPAFFVSTGNFSTDSALDSGSSRTGDSRERERSVNDVTISELHPR
ncbi:hypothetical protein CCACVL1_24363 [Corchorus capsularis]|uniref:Protein kinase domain-containing protein n=1 Tax=Corchorus capsularis TaxID=210143 RepID=A0A1R3GPX3_COCAP|nr:hypothetical protein CCACVL1_24363 [Corchorus capsularis]